MLTTYLTALETSEERSQLTEFYHKHQQLLIKIANNILHNHGRAEDAVHNMYLSLLDHKDILSLPEAKMRRWCVIVVENKAKDILRREQNMDNAVSLDDEDGQFVPNSSPPQSKPT